MNRKLSVIVPAFKASRHILKSLIDLEDELKKLGRPYEVVVVCDGCVDTCREAKKIESDTVKVFFYEHNMGKGYALKYGAVRTTGELVTFIDADMSIDPHEIANFIQLMDMYDSDIVIGSKRHPQSKVNYPLFRRFQSFVYQILVAVLFHMNIRDTQTGLKLFKREVLVKVIPRVMVKAYAFDLELLVVARYLGYKKILEAPVEIKQQFSTTTGLSAAWRVLLDTLAVFYRLRILKYYNQEHIFIEIKESEPRVSIIMPCRTINNYVYESVKHIKDLSYSNYELVIFPDNGEKPADFPEVARVIPTGSIGPAEKRDLSLNCATGDILAFLDDDAYPRADWLINAVKHFHKDNVAAVGGPALTPPDDNLLQRAGGAVYESRLGGSSSTHRYLPQIPREVDDFPSVNLLVRKDVFETIGGFDTRYYPGEDTKLCLDIVESGKTIVYDPDVLVWHHRRPLFLPHLKQVAGYATHRGYFVKKFLKTSLKPSYFVPSLFVAGLVFGVPLSFASKTLAIAYAAVILVYGILLVLTGIWTSLMYSSLTIGFLVMPGIVATHIAYGAFFIKGLLKRKLQQ